MALAFRRSSGSARSVPQPRSGWAFVLALVALAVTACGSRDPTYPGARGDPHLIVHGMLAAGAAQQEIILEYTRGIEDGYFRGLTPASGARITVSGGGVFAFEEDSRRPGVYLASFTPRSGERYTLRVHGPAGETATAETVVPGIPQIVAPARDTVVARDNRVPVRWLSTSAAGYVVVQAPPNQPSPLTRLLYPAIGRDTSAVIQFGVLGGTAFQLRVAAVDSNFVHFAGADTEMSAADRSRIRGTVAGAYGLFGSFGLSNPRLVSLQ